MNEQKPKRLKSWQGWLLFGATLVIVFLLGLFAASVTERRAEIRSIYANKKIDIEPGEAKSEVTASIIPESTTLGGRPQTRPLRADTMGVRRWMCWQSDRRWSSCGQVTPSAATTPPHEGICTLSRTSPIPCGQVPRDLRTGRISSLPHAGPVRDRMCRG